MNPVSRTIEPYGELAGNVGEWFVPDGDDVAPTVVLIHGGFWREQYDRHLEDQVALDLASRGYLCWNIDYRSSALPWPATLIDVAAAYDHLLLGTHGSRVDPTRVAVVGHSAGGHLAAWLAARHRLPLAAPGDNPQAHRPSLVVPQAGVVALTAAAEQQLGSGAAEALLDGFPTQVGDRYAIADPVGLLPTGVRSILIHDRTDDTVPISQSETYVRAATAAGDDSRLEVVPGDHYAHLDPRSEAGQRLRDVLATM